MDKLRLYLYKYLHFKSVKIENGLVQLENNVSIHKADVIDHLDFIVEKTRAEAFREFSNDLRTILSMTR